MGSEMCIRDRENTDFFAKKSWIEKNRDVAQKFTNAIARAQAWMKAATDAQIAAALAPHFPGLPSDITVDVIKRYRGTGAPILSETPQISRPGLAKLQEVMIIGGVIDPSKTVPYESIVAVEFALEAERSVLPK